MHTEDWSDSDEVTMQGSILQAPQELKWVKGKDRHTKHEELVPVVQLLLTDRTGPIGLELWRNCAESMVRDLNAKGDPETEGSIIEVTRCWVRTESKVCFPQTRKITSNEQTSIAFLEAASQPSLIDEDITIHESLYLRDFTALARHPGGQTLQNISWCG